MRLIRRLIVLAFAVVQLILVARILLDLDVIPTEGALGDLIVPWSDALAAPVAGLGDGLSQFLGGGAMFGGAGDGLNPAMVAALIGWSIVEGLVLRVARKFEAV